ncbi:uncharacterized protein LOC107359892 isoform X3 [Tetranychus urticae]|uniref:uncharacterized protein LOC107359892 isoform X3 n=1 Tax=Tetranychus urticae TaxID=32264 RepID=UPI00077C00FF|nr:uncharacterized protein LOC107359892 isoform X3 [Tetranychus urticae]
MQTIAFGFILFVTFCLFSVFPTVSTQTHGQSCHLRELDLCAATLLVFTQNPSGIATTGQEMNKQCGYLREADSCLRNFTRKCTTPLQRELIGFVTEGGMRLLNEYCSPATQLRQSYLKHAPCLNQAQRNQRMCVKDLQAALEIIANVEWDRRIPAGCCAYRRFQGCVVNLVESKCGKEAVEFIHILLRMALSRLPDIICVGYGPQTSECRALLPPPGTPPRGARSNSVLSRLFSAYTGL